MMNLFTSLQKKKKAIFASDLSSNLDQSNENIYAGDFARRIFCL